MKKLLLSVVVVAVGFERSHGTSLATRVPNLSISLPTPILTLGVAPSQDEVWLRDRSFAGVIEAAMFDSISIDHADNEGWEPFADSGMNCETADGLLINTDESHRSFMAIAPGQAQYCLKNKDTGSVVSFRMDIKPGLVVQKFIRVPDHDEATQVKIFATGRNGFTGTSWIHDTDPDRSCEMKYDATVKPGDDGFSLVGLKFGGQTLCFKEISEFGGEIVGEHRVIISTDFAQQDGFYHSQLDNAGQILEINKPFNVIFQGETGRASHWRLDEEECPEMMERAKETSGFSSKRNCAAQKDCQETIIHLQTLEKTGVVNLCFIEALTRARLRTQVKIVTKAFATFF